MFEKKCPLCNESFSSLEHYMKHIKNKHSKEAPEKFVKHKDEIKWSFRNGD
ncbi:MAG: C2H2-type zinc finger protein [Nitrosopumilaceae archaeon]|nr:C2H2-type zinc finger protein [Nitrosopumilaceae archaeon]